MYVQYIHIATLYVHAYLYNRDGSSCTYPELHNGQIVIMDNTYIRILRRTHLSNAVQLCLSLVLAQSLLLVWPALVHPKASKGLLVGTPWKEHPSRLSGTCHESSPPVLPNSPS